MELTRRELLATFLGGPAALAAGCSESAPQLPVTGEIVGDVLGASAAVGHRVRDFYRPTPSVEQWERSGVVIVGGGVAGLSAAWRLKRDGFEDFVLLELEERAGGTSCSGTVSGIPCPWGAHYLPVPMQSNRALIALLEELGIIEGRDGVGEPIVGEQFLCRDPQERLFHQGVWHEGLYLHDGEDAEDQRQWTLFREQIDHWAGWRDARGRRAFAIPIATSSDDAELTALDNFSMSEWIAQNGFTSSRLQWMVNYACRDDYGLTADLTSAWAGLFYFASRVRAPGREAQPLITWPEGNGRLVSHLQTRAGDRERLGWAVSEVVPREDARGVDVIAFRGTGDEVLGIHARQAIFCAPHFLAPHVIRGFRDARGEDSARFEYGPWLVANLYLKDRPRSVGFPPAWDNVLYDSPSLGYVVATHQQGVDRGPTVFTYYYPLCDADPRRARERLLGLKWNEWADIVLTDLEQAHPDIRHLVERLDVIRWGHAMIRPRPGFVWGGARVREAQAFGPVRFAHSDLSGVALFEEAFYHGIRAAEEVLRENGWSFEPLL